MKIRVEVIERGAVIYLEGEMDASTSILVDREIDNFYQLELPNLWVNCQNLHYISSAGIGVFISHLQRMKDLEKNLVILGLKPNIKSVFSVLGLEPLLNLQDSTSLLA